MADLVESETDTCLHLVALPEEMPVNEALELSAAAGTKLRMARGVVFLNRWHAPLLRAEDQEAFGRLAQLASPKLAPYLDAAQIRLLREKIERAHGERLAREAKMPVQVIAEAPADIPDPALLERVVEEIDRALGARP